MLTLRGGHLEDIGCGVSCECVFDHRFRNAIRSLGVGEDIVVLPRGEGMDATSLGSEGGPNDMLLGLFGGGREDNTFRWHGVFVDFSFSSPLRSDRRCRLEDVHLTLTKRLTECRCWRRWRSGLGQRYRWRSHGNSWTGYRLVGRGIGCGLGGCKLTR